RGRRPPPPPAAAAPRHTIEADIVVGADGLHSVIAAATGAPDLVRGRSASGILYTYWEDVLVDGYSWRFFPNASLGAIPTNNGTCLFVSTPSRRFHELVRGGAALAYRRLLHEL